MISRRRNIPRSLAIVTLLAPLCGCDGDPGAKVAQRDVYKTLDDCVADWGNAELCREQMTAEQAKEAAKTAGGGNSSVVILGNILGNGGFYGPAYSGAAREVVHNGTRVTPTTTSAAQTAQFARGLTGNAMPSSFTAPKVPIGQHAFGGRGPAISAASAPSPFTAAATAARSAAASTTSMGSATRGGFGASAASASSAGG